MSELTVKSLRPESTRSACSPRGDSSRPNSTYAGNESRLGLLGPAADQGQLLLLYNQPLAGLRRCGLSSTDRRPCQSVAVSLPSTGLVQSNFVERRGMKLA